MSMGGCCASIGPLLACLAGVTLANSSGIAGVTRGPADLVTPPSAPEGAVWRYGAGWALQVGPRTAALLCNIRREGFPVGDFEAGTDVVLFDDLSAITAARAIPIARGERPGDPWAAGDRVVIKHPVIGGFVPLGARHADGSPHPHAGTGFGVCWTLTFPPTEGGWFDWESECRTALEVRQFAYDGHTFRVVQTRTYPQDAPFTVADSGWGIFQPGYSPATPDGDDLLFSVWAKRGELSACGVTRWRRRFGIWRPVSFVPVTDPDVLWSEPSLIRDTDGALLFTARAGEGEALDGIAVWRSSDDGQTWERIIYALDVRHQAPITIHRAVDGAPYIASTPAHRVETRWHNRETLCLWPLTPDRSGLAEPVVARRAAEEFGPAPGESVWMVDHPSSAVLRLADGKWHNVLVYRVMHADEHRGEPPMPQTGLYVEEVQSAGPPISAWRFD
jgi:hypothetical protein